MADFYNHRVQKFSAEGEFLASFGSPGSGPGQLDRPIDMAVDENGSIYVVDFEIIVFKSLNRCREAELDSGYRR